MLKNRPREYKEIIYKTREIVNHAEVNRLCHLVNILTLDRPSEKKREIVYRDNRDEVNRLCHLVNILTLNRPSEKKEVVETHDVVD